LRFAEESSLETPARKGKPHNRSENNTQDERLDPHCNGSGRIFPDRFGFVADGKNGNGGFLLLRRVRMLLRRRLWLWQVEVAFVEGRLEDFVEAVFFFLSGTVFFFLSGGAFLRRSCVRKPPLGKGEEQIVRH